MTLTTKDIQSIVTALQPEFDKVRSEFSGEFGKVRAEAKKNFETLSKKIESLRRTNHKDHNLIIDLFDKRDLKLQARVQKFENSPPPRFHNL